MNEAMIQRKNNSLFGVVFNDLTLKIISIALKVLGVALGIAFLWATLSNQYSERNIYTLYEVAPNAFGRAIIVIIKFLANAAIVACMVAPFFYFRSTDKIVRYLTPVVVILRFLFSADLLKVALGPSSDNTYFIIQQFIVEQALLIAICLISWVLFFFAGRARQTKKDILRTSIFAFIGVIMLGFINVPYSFFTGLFGPAMATAIDFSFPHRFAIYSLFFVPFITMFLFRKMSYKARWYICLQLSISAFFVFFRSKTFIEFQNPVNWPLHLCNTAVIIMLVAFIFRLKPAFYFAYLINVLGTLFALFLPDKTGDIFYSYSINYWHNHLMDAWIPAIAVGLKVFDRPKFKYVLYALTGFSVYFIIVAYMDARFGYKGADFFFLNGDKFTSYAEAFEHIRLDFNLVIPIKGEPGQLTIKWLYWLLVYIIYCGLAFAIWFVYTLVYRISDSHMDCHKKAKAKHELAKERKLYLASLKEGEQK